MRATVNVRKPQKLLTWPRASKLPKWPVTQTFGPGWLTVRIHSRLFGIVIVAPILQLTVLGYAATTDVKDVPLVVVDADRSTASRELLSRFDASDNFTIVDVVGSTTDIDDWLEKGNAWMALSIPPDYGGMVARGETATIQIVADGTDSNSTNVALGYARVLLAFIYALAHQARRVEAFAFSTRLSRITRALKEREIDAALRHAAASIDDYAGGTRIGAALKAFNFEWGRRVLGQGAIVLIISFDADVTALIQLYVVGVFVSFTVSQLGMLRHWTRHLKIEKDPAIRARMIRSRVINAIGLTMTATVLVIVLLSKFTKGAYIAIIAMAVLFVIMRMIRRHYETVSRETALVEGEDVLRHGNE